MNTSGLVSGPVHWDTRARTELIDSFHPTVVLLGSAAATSPRRTGGDAATPPGFGRVPGVGQRQLRLGGLRRPLHRRHRADGAVPNSGAARRLARGARHFHPSTPARRCRTGSGRVDDEHPGGPSRAPRCSRPVRRWPSRRQLDAVQGDLRIDVRIRSREGRRRALHLRRSRDVRRAVARALARPKVGRHRRTQCPGLARLDPAGDHR